MQPSIIALVIPLLSVSSMAALSGIESVGTNAPAIETQNREPGLVGYWRLRGDCRDASGQGNHGVNHGVDLARGEFDGVGDYIEVPASPSLQFGVGDFTLSAWVCTANELDDVIGDVLDLYDPVRRRGITLTMASSGSGYQGQGNDRHVYFGIDNAQLGEWRDCGRPSKTSRYVSNSMLVYKGKLYAATSDGKSESDWCHVYRYEGKQKWVDCGRVGSGRTTGVGPLVVHDGELYAVTSTYDWTRVKSGKYDAGKVYRYVGGTNWIDCGQPSDNPTLNGAVSYKGDLYVGGGPMTWGVFVQKSPDSWEPSKIFAKEWGRGLFPHPMTRYNGKLFVGFPGVYAFDGREWVFAGAPSPPNSNPAHQTHSFTVYNGSLCAGTWPEAKVAKYLGGEDWEVFGRVGIDGTEVNGLIVYNGKLYGGSIPRAEVCRYDGSESWTSLRRFYSPAGWQPVAPGIANRQEVKAWSRVTCLAIHEGKLFAGIGNCTSAVADVPNDPEDVLGKVFCVEAGKCVSFDEDIGAGWRHIVAVREGSCLKLYVDGKMVSKSDSFRSSDYDLSIDHSLKIGFGQTDFFQGRIAEVRAYNRAITAGKIRDLFDQKPR